MLRHKDPITAFCTLRSNQHSVAIAFSSARFILGTGGVAEHCGPCEMTGIRHMPMFAEGLTKFYRF